MKLEETQKLILSSNGTSGLFKNDKGEYCRVISWYERNTRKFQIIFSKNDNETANRFAINSISEKKIVKILTEEGFKIIN